MDPQDRLKQRIVEAVKRFEHDQLSLNPLTVDVDLHPESLVVTFRGATSPAEKSYAQDATSGERLERVYGQVFDVVRPLLESAITSILGRQVERSKLTVDVGTGDGIILFTLAR